MDEYRVEPESKIKLKQVDPGDTAAYSGGKSAANTEIAHLTRKLDQLQRVLYAQHAHKILVVLQGMDTSGKDGTIRHVFQGINPEGVRVANFKQPVPEELDHDFLWRIHQQVPGKGELVIFNRSHYEDV
ncbi:MAG TPA: polyphosphate kinase 2 family protein, partial [Anaerolineaceae bacterium]